ncbi:hypothetical protein DFH07DRAFT_808411 [Mycena maculata]|uniref:Uncharacterized protein n=1 Tax=Mycena maculata TaxID=230809 RepID=A0AAD7NMD8_9AGAR|nr:hypothetical protein DFH07DRAFT_808411 [Mycena maculata]
MLIPTILISSEPYFATHLVAGMWLLTTWDIAYIPYQLFLGDTAAGLHIHGLFSWVANYLVLCLCWVAARRIFTDVCHYSETVGIQYAH